MRYLIYHSGNVKLALARIRWINLYESTCAVDLIVCWLRHGFVAAIVNCYWHVWQIALWGCLFVLFLKMAHVTPRHVLLNCRCHNSIISHAGGGVAPEQTQEHREPPLL
jgi:hypothetical protein